MVVTSYNTAEESPQSSTCRRRHGGDTSFMSEDLSRIARQQTTLMELMNEVKLLKKNFKEKDKQSGTIHEDGRCQIISGLDVKPWFYAKVAATERSDGEDACIEGPTVT